MDLLEEAKIYKKVSYDKWKEEKYERKGYFHSLDLGGARMMFRLAGNMFPARGNFPSLYRKDTLACQSCVNLNSNGTDNITIVETQNHLAFECPAFQDLRDSGLDLVNSDQDIVTFFTAVNQRRMELGKT